MSKQDIERMSWAEFLANLEAIRVAINSGRISKEDAVEVGAKALDAFFGEGQKQ